MIQGYITPNAVCRPYEGAPYQLHAALGVQLVSEILIRQNEIKGSRNEKN